MSELNKLRRPNMKEIVDESFVKLLKILMNNLMPNLVIMVLYLLRQIRVRLLMVKNTINQV